MFRLSVAALHGPLGSFEVAVNVVVFLPEISAADASYVSRNSWQDLQMFHFH